MSPLIVTKVSPTFTVLAITTFGVRAIKSSGLSMPASSISPEVNTLIAMGTSWTLSSTLRADTTTSSRVGSAIKLKEIKIKLIERIIRNKLLDKVMFVPYKKQ